LEFRDAAPGRPTLKSVASTPFIRVSVENPPGPPASYEFRQTFRIGRADNCDISINNKYVSRDHLEVTFEDGQWQVRDLNSINGMLVSGQPARSLQVTATTAVRLGLYGPFVSLSVDPAEYTSPLQPAPEKERPLTDSDSVEYYIDHYFGAGNTGQSAGGHTSLVRMAFSQVQRKHKFRWLSVVGALLLLVVCVTAYAEYERERAGRQRTVAESIFYSMKALEVDIGNFERMVADTNNAGLNARLRKYQDRRTQLQGQYDKFLTTIRADDLRLTPRERLTLRIARIFGECELAMPPGFQAEIDKYIQQWKTSDRLAVALAAAKERGYIGAIRKELLAVDLPPQFLYLALQESNFDPYASGPDTYKGIAKGMWQFIPETAIRYGLRTGPLVRMRRPDPADDRHRWEVETKAAARYLKDLYTGDAQASGLLVMACYNWGEDRVVPLVRSLPANPADRNFWKLLAKYRGKLPDETYSYVLSIVSAAIIGEDPRLFGFDFDNPLVSPEK
jgi:membrane-bound lytic murein transglycosylase D